MPKLLRLLLVMSLILWSSQSIHGQSPITTINTSSSAAPDSQYNQTAPADAGNNLSGGTNYTVRNGRGNDIEVTSYVVSGTTYNNFLTPDTLALRRTDGSRFVNIWYTLIQINTGPNPDQLDLDPRAVEDADLIYKTRNINAGYDNILVNVDDLASDAIQAQIERVDAIWYTGIVTCEPDNAVFPIIERGGNDNIRVAAITSLDSNGDPNGYSSTVLIQASDWPGTGRTFNNYLILRRQVVGQDPLPLLNVGTIAGQAAQTVQGVAVSFTELGIAANQVIYGYSIFASDTNENTPGIDLTNINTFPTNTLSSVSGLDLVAGVTAAVSSDNCLTPAVGPGGYKACLATWLKANVGVTTATNNSTISDWQDQWVGDNDATFSTGTVVYKSTSSNINFNPTADFGNGNNSLDIANNADFNIGGPYAKKGINLAFRTSTSDINTRQVLYEQGGATRGINIYIRDGFIHLTAWNRANDGAGAPWNDSGSGTTINTAVTANTEYIVTLEENGNSSGTGTVTAYLNGQSFGSFGNVGLLYNHSGGIQLGGADGNTRFDDGTNNSGNSFFGEISELIYCNEPGAFPLANRNRIESYLAIKYGITLNQSVPINYVNSAGSIIFNTTSPASIGGFLEYNKDIAGIGRDDNSAFEQQKSRSENNNSVVTIDHGGNFSTNNSWLIWGNDGGADTDTETTDVPPLITQRVERVWRAGETGETGNNTITFDLNELNIAGSPTASDYSLLVAGNSSNGDFSSATVLTGGVISGNTISFSNVNLENGQYFTLGTGFIDCAPGAVSTNLTLWLKADIGPNLITDGSNVSTWADQAGSNDATAASGDEPNFVSNSINFNPALNFDAANTEHISGSAGFNSSAYYIVLNTDQTYNNSSPQESILEFVVPAAATNQFGSFIFGEASSAISAEVFSHSIGGTGTRWRRGTNFAAFGGISNNQTLMFGVKNNAANNNTEIFANGRNQVNLQSGTFLTSTNVGYRIGGNLAANSFSSDTFDGQIAEVISLSARPTDAEHNRIQSYLALKYGITLSQNSAQNYVNSSGTTVWNATTNITYNKDIAGIGRDDGSCFQQKQSKSENAGSIVSIGNGGIYTDNASNPNSFANDNSFLVWGNNAASALKANVNTSDVPGNVTERMSRVWRVDESGTVGGTSVSFDLTGLGYSSNASDFQLIVSSSSTMASGSTFSGGTLNGNVITFNNVDFADGDYFTLGTARETCGPGGVTTDLALWLRADEGTGTTTNNADLNTWADQSTAGRNANEVNLNGAVPVEPRYQTNQINFNPAINISDPSSTNASYMKTSGGNNVSEDFSLIAVFETGQAGGSTINFEDAPTIIGAGVSGSSADYGLGISEGRVHMNAANNSTLNVRSTSGPVYNNFEPFIATGTRRRLASAGSIQLYINSANVGSGTSTTTSLSNPTSFGIGNHHNPNVASQFNGRIAEVLVFADDLTDNERQRVESYLAVKYGITRNAGGTSTEDYLSSAGTITWDWSEQPVYNNDIAGIGRDDDSCFQQWKSKSENDDAIVTMEMAGTFPTDNSFLIWGNDNVAMEGTREDGNTEYNTSQVSGRLFREWYVQETGNVGTVNLTFDLATITGPTGIGTNNLNQVRLMVDNDGDFTSGVTLVAPTSIDATNKKVTFAVNLSDTQFFTLGSLQASSLPITLISFNAKKTNENNVRLDWSTASEFNNAYFTIERGTSLEDFEGIHTLVGAGNSKDVNNYFFVDEKPKSGNNFYRLRQTDFNGTSTVSEIKRVFIENQSPTQTFNAFPNPVDQGELITLEYNVDAENEVLVQMITGAGVLINSQSVILYPETGTIQLETKGLSKGLIMIIVTDQQTQKRQTFKVIVR
ncbi:beta strand repeat-containing protein [Roseivirga echinicomitans]